MAKWIKKVATAKLDIRAKVIDSLEGNQTNHAPSIHAVNDAFTGWFSAVTNDNTSNVANNTAIDAAPRITLPSDGLYLAIGYVEWSGSSTGSRSVRINKNEISASDYVTISASSDDTIRQQVVFMNAFSEGDILSLGVRQSSGETITITRRRLSIYRLSKNTFES